MCTENETASYSCTTSTPEVQWIVEPFLPASGLDAIIVANLPSSVGAVVSRTGMMVEHVSINPFLTRLTINTSVITSSVNVTCSTLGLTPERFSTLRYVLDDGKHHLSVHEYECG